MESKKRTEDRAAGLLRILTTWRKRAEQAGRTIARIVVAFEAGRDGFWLARWLRRTGIEAYVIHPSSIRSRAGSGENRPDRHWHAATCLFKLRTAEGQPLPPNARAELERLF